MHCHVRGFPYLNITRMQVSISVALDIPPSKGLPTCATWHAESSTWHSYKAYAMCGTRHSFATWNMLVAPSQLFAEGYVHALTSVAALENQLEPSNDHLPSLFLCWEAVCREDIFVCRVPRDGHSTNVYIYIPIESLKLSRVLFAKRNTRDISMRALGNVPGSFFRDVRTQWQVWRDVRRSDGSNIDHGQLNPRADGWC